MPRCHQGEACNSVFAPNLRSEGELLVSECLHGGVDTGETGYGTTSFPQPLSLAATFDRKLLHQIASMISDEMRAISNLYRQADGTARSKILSSFVVNSVQNESHLDKLMFITPSKDICWQS